MKTEEKIESITFLLNIQRNLLVNHLLTIWGLPVFNLMAYENKIYIFTYIKIMLKILCMTDYFWNWSKFLIIFCNYYLIFFCMLSKIQEIDPTKFLSSTWQILSVRLANHQFLNQIRQNNFNFY